jgi:uncharacterized integral membrane protein
MERITHWLAWLAIALIAVFAGLNWSALIAETSLNLLVMHVQAPLGIVLLGLTALFVVLFFLATLYSRISSLMESRRLLKDVRSAQERADHAEASRVEKLERLILGEFRTVNARLGELEAGMRPARAPQIPQS